jgi:hypothetical protein
MYHTLSLLNIVVPVLLGHCNSSKVIESMYLTLRLHIHFTVEDYNVGLLTAVDRVVMFHPSNGGIDAYDGTERECYFRSEEVSPQVFPFVLPPATCYGAYRWLRMVPSITPAISRYSIIK